MNDDPAIQQVRDVRHKISENLNHDAEKIVEYYRQRQERHGSRLENHQNETQQDNENVVGQTPS